MAKRTSKRRGSSKAGRPRIKDAERYANGRLKPRKPNPTLIEKRRAGNADAGEHPLDFALSQGWLTERQHRDAMAYRAAYRFAHIGGPRLSSGSLQEVPEEDLPPLEVLMRNLSQIPDADITAAWDKFFGEADAPPVEIDNPQALARWRLLNAGLSPAEQQQLFTVSVLGSWPFWMPKVAADRALGAQDRARRGALMSAITGVGRSLRPPRQETMHPVPHKAARKPSTEVPVRYEDQDGQPVTPTSVSGRPFEVAVAARRRRA